MKFFEKLDILMKVTNTSNTRLGRAVSFDASYISRIRSGSRNAPKNRQFLEKISEYFVRNINDEYQKKILADFMCPDKKWPADSKNAEKLICAWLSKSETDDFKDAENTEGTYNMPSEDENTASAAEKPAFSDGYDDGNGRDAYFFYGNEGKRQAVEKFLVSLCELNKPITVLLCSTEEFDWLYEKPDFAKKWAYLMQRFIRQGGKIKIIHTISRDAYEMITALQKWIPIYMTGSVEPYYYPKLRDRIYRRTLFVAPSHSAVVSNSVQENTKNSLNLLITKKDAVSALEKEFGDYLSLCKPLLNIYDIYHRDSFFRLLSAFEESGDKLIKAVSSPSFVLLPENMEKELIKHCKRKNFVKLLKEYKENFFQRISKGAKITEILHLPDIESTRANRVRVPMCEIFGSPDMVYTAEDFRNHLINVLDCMKKYGSYSVVLSDRIPADQIIYVKEDFGAIVVKAYSPTSAFGISESRMTAAFWGYLSGVAYDSGGREKTVKALENYIEKLGN